MVTIRHVAQEADVSVGTVSRVLNNKPGVSEKTRQHVLAVARELGYTLPRRSLLSTSTVTHLKLLSRPMREALPANPFYADVFHGIEQVCHEFRINLSFSSLGVVNGRLRSLPALINDERVSGIALVGFDDVPAASVIEPTLTIVRQPIERLGCMAVEVLLSVLEGLPEEGPLSIGSSCLQNWQSGPLAVLPGSFW